MDFSAGALPIGMKFCMAVQPHLGQVFHCGEDGHRDSSVMGVSRDHMSGSTCDYWLHSSALL